MMDEVPIETPKLWMDYVSLDPSYQKLKDLKKKGWLDEAGDTFFQNRRSAASNPDQQGKESFYQMTKQVGKGLASKTRIFEHLELPKPKILDLCMAPGGFSATAKKELPTSIIDAVTLPKQVGGYDVMATDICEKIIYADITMYPTEMAYEEDIPTGHPDSNHFEQDQPFLGSFYDIVFCGGAVGRNHFRESYRNTCEPQRLTISQVVFAMHRLKRRGSIVLLLHRVESWDTVCILHAFSQFSDIQLYKHPRAHAIKSSFYLIARDIDLDHHAAKESMKYWKSLWKYLTFRNFCDIPKPQSHLFEFDNDFAQKLRDDFGSQFLRLGRPIWDVQAKALQHAPFMRHSIGENMK